MINMMESAKAQVAELVSAAYEKAEAEGALPRAEAPINGGVEATKDPRNGDYASSFALTGAKALKMKPRDVALEICSRLDFAGSYFASADIAGPGFINFTLGPSWYSAVLGAIDSERADYGETDMGKGEKVMVEFVSANPTGPMTIGNARGGVLGDTLASVLEKTGHSVWREFYVNDAGNQVDLFGKSIEARYIQLLHGEDAVEFPENGYHGDDIKALAQMIYDKDGDKYDNMDSDERCKALVEFALPYNIAQMKKHLERYRIRFDKWFLESTLHESGYIEETVAILEKGGHTYEKDGALWLRNTDFGAEKDECLRRSNGFYTYYAVDIAYHRNKFVARGFDRVIDVWGADHHGHAIRFKASMKDPALGIDADKLDFVIMQMVRLVRDGETIKVSKRTGKALTLNDLLDEISVDACRFFFNAKPDTHLEFDLGLAVREDSENPVYYVQYAHARICSLVKMLAEEGFEVPGMASADASLLSDEPAVNVVKTLARYPDELRTAARDYDPSRINRYLVELAAAFHKFYNADRIKGEEVPVLLARLKLADCVRTVLENALSVIGVSAPEHM
ncbi:MAG: arginine--tRNA ligase [Oscillospiraceae bacterium]|nr:arginine--tRNA ligase [Oscillospiraceae bacterium]